MFTAIFEFFSILKMIFSTSQVGKIDVFSPEIDFRVNLVNLGRKSGWNLLKPIYKG